MNSHIIDVSRLRPEVLAIAEKAKAEGHSRGKTLEKWKALEAAERKTWKGKIKYAWKDYVYYPLYRWIRKPGEWIDALIAFWQRGRRGYADSDTWGINSYLSSFLPEMLLHMIDKEKGGGVGYPGAYSRGAETFAKWEKIVHDIADGFRAHREMGELEFDKANPEAYYKAQRRLQEQQWKGLRLFVKWYGYLWD